MGSALRVQHCGVLSDDLVEVGHPSLQELADLVVKICDRVSVMLGQHPGAPRGQLLDTIYVGVPQSRMGDLHGSSELWRIWFHDSPLAGHLGRETISQPRISQPVETTAPRVIG